MSSQARPGSINQLSSYWPDQIQWRQPPPLTSKADYANDVEVVRGDHDATLRFYRKKGTNRSLVYEITVPLALLKALGS